MDHSNKFIQPFIRSMVIFPFDRPIDQSNNLMYTLGRLTDSSFSLMYPANSFPRNILLKPFDGSSDSIYDLIYVK